LPAGRQILAIERTYREGLKVILDPTPEELEMVRNGKLWDLWSSDRAKSLFSIVRQQESVTGEAGGKVKAAEIKP
jgi:hypothetical protein